MTTGWTEHAWTIIKEGKALLEEHWFVFAGGMGALWAMVVRAKRSILQQYATIDELGNIERRIIDKIDRMDEKNTEQHNDIYQTMLRLHGHTKEDK